MVCRIRDELAEKSCQVLGGLLGRSASVANSGSQRDPFFMYVGESIQSRGCGAGRTQLFANIFCGWIF